MPIGVPKVPVEVEYDEYEYDEEEDTSLPWIDLYTWLYDERAIFLFQEIDGPVANRIISSLVLMDRENPIDDIFFFISSPGGGILDGLAIYDTMQMVEPDIKTIGLGSVASTASLILAGGQRAGRIAFPRARIMLHQPSLDLPDMEMGDFLSELDEINSLYETAAIIYAERTGQSISTIVEDMDRDTFFSAKEAKAYGLIDDIVIEKRAKPRGRNTDYASFFSQEEAKKDDGFGFF